MIDVIDFSSRPLNMFKLNSKQPQKISKTKLTKTKTKIILVKYKIIHTS